MYRQTSWRLFAVLLGALLTGCGGGGGGGSEWDLDQQKDMGGREWTMESKLTEGDNGLVFEVKSLTHSDGVLPAEMGLCEFDADGNMIDEHYPEDGEEGIVAELNPNTVKIEVWGTASDDLGACFEAELPE